MILTKEIKILCKNHKKYYIQKGYNWVYNAEIIVKVEDLPDSSHELLDVLCDYCNRNIMTKPKYAYSQQNKNSIIQKDCCEECWHLKLADSMDIIYGKNNASNIVEFIEKRENTFINKFGVDNPMKKQEIVLKGKQTNIKKYGVDHKMKVDGEYEKRITKIRETMFANDTGIKSTQQIYLHDLFGGILNYPVGKYLLDIAFTENKIFCEYDGSGHDLQVHLGNITENERLNKDLKRYYFLKNRGWKFIRIVSNKDKLPNKKILNYLFNLGVYHLNNERTYFEINIDNNYIKYNNQIIYIDLGKLRKITKKDIQQAI